MKQRLILILALAILAGGCVGLQGEKVPVLYVNVTMGEDNGTMVIQNIEAHGGEMPKLAAPGYQYAEKFPAVYVNLVQDMKQLAYQTGKNYIGPGVYGFTVGFEGKLNRSVPAVVTVEAINATAETADLKYLAFNWSESVQSKTFK